MKRYKKHISYPVLFKNFNFCAAEWVGNQQSISENFWREESPHFWYEENHGFWCESNDHQHFINDAIDRLHEAWTRARTGPRALLLQAHHHGSSQDPARLQSSYIAILFELRGSFLFKTTVPSDPKRSRFRLPWFLFLCRILLFWGIMNTNQESRIQMGKKEDAKAAMGLK